MFDLYDNNINVQPEEPVVLPFVCPHVASDGWTQLAFEIGFT